jgi:hypothetical protein
MNNSNPFEAFSNIPEGMIAVVILAVIIGLGIGLTIFIFYLLNLQNALKQCSVQNQKMLPGQVWLALIPFFNYYWNFRIATALADSLSAEFKMRGLHLNEERPGYQVGTAYAILTCCGVLSWFGVPIFPQLAGLAGFVCWIVYWVRIHGYKKQLMVHQPFAFGNPNPYPFPNQFPNQQQHNPQGQYNQQQGQYNPQQGQYNPNPTPNPYSNQPPNQPPQQ